MEEHLRVDLCGRSLLVDGFLPQLVAALILLLHPIDEEEDEEHGEHQTNGSSCNQSWEARGRSQNEEGRSRDKERGLHPPARTSVLLKTLLSAVCDISTLDSSSSPWSLLSDGISLLFLMASSWSTVGRGSTSGISLLSTSGCTDRRRHQKSGGLSGVEFNAMKCFSPEPKV